MSSSSHAHVSANGANYRFYAVRRGLRLTLQKLKLAVQSMHSGNKRHEKILLINKSIFFYSYIFSYIYTESLLVLFSLLVLVQVAIILEANT